MPNNEEFKRQQQELAEEIDNLNEQDLPTANIIVAGITGTGKSTLINAVFGEEMAKTGVGRPITDNIDDYALPDVPVRIWDTVGLELDSAKTKDSIRDIRNTIAQKASSDNMFDRIHAIWYCINAGSNRYQGAELEFIKDLHSIGVPFIIVLTQCIQSEDEVNGFEESIREINSVNGMADVEIVQVCAKDFKMRGFSIPKFGLEKLVKLTTEKLPAFIKEGFIAAQKVDVVQKRILCEDIIMHYIDEAKNGFFDKIAVINLFTTSSKIKKMINAIGKIYNMVIPAMSIEQILKDTSVDLNNLFSALINPFYGKYKGRVANYLEEMRKKDGFKVNIDEFEASERSARMIALYGYTFVEAIEELWNEYTTEQLSKIDETVAILVTKINAKLKEAGRKRHE